jgi:hypothetical protein
MMRKIAVPTMDANADAYFGVGWKDLSIERAIIQADR